MSYEPSQNAIHAAARYLWTEAGKPTASAASYMSQAPAAALRLGDIMRDIESLGGHSMGCEVGMVQRHYDVETLGLLRWAEMTPRSLTDAMRARFEGVGLPENTKILKKPNKDKIEYITHDPRFVMDMHSFIYTDVMTEQDFLTVACKRLRFLQGKILSDLSSNAKLFVFKISTRTMSDAELHTLRDAMTAIGENTLLYVRLADEEHPAPMVEDRGGGLMIGYIDRWVNASGHNITGWTQVLRRGWEIWRCEEAFPQATSDQSSPAFPGHATGIRRSG